MDQAPPHRAGMGVSSATQSPPRTAVWQWLDLTGDGQDELVLLRTSTGQNAHLNHLLSLTPDASGAFSLRYNQPLTSREQLAGPGGSRPELAATGDLTQDRLPDVVVRDIHSGLSFVLTTDADSVQRLPLPGSCTGSLGIMDVDADGLAEVVRDGCVEGNGRTVQAAPEQHRQPAHVVQRQHAQPEVIGVQTKPISRGGGAPKMVGKGEQYAFGLAGGAGSENDGLIMVNIKW